VGRPLSRRTTLSSALHYLSAASLLTTAALERAGTAGHGPLPESSAESFHAFLARLAALPDSVSRMRLVKTLAEHRAMLGTPFIEDTAVTFIYCGAAVRVTVPGDLNGWNPAADAMTRVQGTNLFYLVKRAEAAARFEYKFAVDSTWILDPFNRRTAMGGFGPNSEIWMPAYTPPAEVVPRLGIPHGRIDTLLVESAILGRRYTAFIYVPPGYAAIRGRLPSLLVTDGGEYLTLGLMNTVLDNLIADRRIRPLLGVFLDPRMDLRDPETSMRMEDYAMNDSFAGFLTGEVLPLVRSRYRVSTDPGETGIMGASLGGLCATHAAFTHPDVFGLCAAQSPSYWWNDDALMNLIDREPKRPVRFSIDTGTIGDAQEGARRMRDVLKRKGYPFAYAEYPEGHNWVNWRSRIDDILTTFWPNMR
jgi:enterochelin esterase-like enzyme